MSTPKILAILLAILLAVAGIDYVQSQKEQKQAATADLLIKGFEPRELISFRYRSTNTTPTTDFSAHKTPRGFMISGKQQGKLGSATKSTTQIKADDRAIEAMAELFATTRFSRRIGSSNLSEFGLDNPAVTLGFATSTTSYTLHIGNRTPSSYARYAAIEGRPDVYVISDALYMAADKKLLDFRDRRIITVPLSQLKSIRYSKTQNQSNPSKRKPKLLTKTTTMTKAGERWLLGTGTGTGIEGRQRGSATTITDLVTTLNSLEAARIVDSPSKQLLKAYGIRPGAAPRWRGLKQLIQLDFQLTGAKAEHNTTKTLTLLEREDSLIAYSDPTKAISFLAPKAMALLAIDDFSYRKVFDLDAPSAIDFATIDSVQISTNSRQYLYTLDPKSLRWLPTSAGSSGSGSSGSGSLGSGASGGLSPIDIKGLLIDLEFANAIRSYTSKSELPAGYEDSPKVKVNLKAGDKPALDVTIARLAASESPVEPPVAIISYPADPADPRVDGLVRFYEVSPATVRSIKPLLKPVPD